MARQRPSLTITFTWQDPPKRWRVDYWLPSAVGPGVQAHSVKINSQHPIDAVTARQMVSSLETLMLQELLW